VPSRDRRGRHLGHVIRSHHDGPGHFLGEDPDLAVPQADHVPVLELGALDLLAVDEGAVGTASVADRDPLGARFQHGVTPGTLRVGQHEIAGGVAAEDRNGPLQLHVVGRPRRVADLESHSSINPVLVGSLHEL
jgi:hypothetical protein